MGGCKVGCADSLSRHSGVRNWTTNEKPPKPRGCVNLPYNTESDRNEWTTRIKKESGVSAEPVSVLG
jgi:hypothetical protein